MIPMRSIVLLSGVRGEIRGRQQGLKCGKPFKRYDVLTADGMVNDVPEERLEVVE